MTSRGACRLRFVCHIDVKMDKYDNDDDIYIMVECIYPVCHKSDYFQVATSWIADDDDIYIMVESLSPVCNALSFPLFSPSVMPPMKTYYHYNEC